MVFAVLTDLYSKLDQDRSDRAKKSLAGSVREWLMIERVPM